MAGGPGKINEYNQTLTPEQRKESARRAAEASGAARRKYKTMRECLKQVLRLDVANPKTRQILEDLGLEPSRSNAIALQTIAKAADGDIEAARFVRDTVGEKPTEAYQLAVTDKPIKALDLTGMSDAELEALADQADG